jgi:ADP-ribose pyrophosphatase
MPPSARSPQRRSRRVSFSGRVFRVESDRVRLANGRVATLDVVRHRGSVVLVPQPTPDAIILIRQFRYAIDRWIWELPAGSIDPGESPRHAARRECEEEIGWTPRRLEPLGLFYPTPGFCDESMRFYRCRDLVPLARPVAQDPDEAIEPKTFAVTDVRRMIARGEIIDMKTVVGLALLAPPRRRR